MQNIEVKPYSECNILIVDDDAISRLLLESILHPHFLCKTAQSGDDAIAQCESQLPDLILLDMNMPDVDGLAVCSKLKKQARTRNIPIIFVTSTMDVESENACWEVGASDFVMKPVNASTLTHRVKNHLQSKLRTEQLARMTFYDQLTSLYNRLYLTNEVPSVIKQVARDKGKVGAIMVDVDHFKLFNDTYGHLEGDACLQKVATLLAKTVKRPQDTVVRFGGEEFLLILPFVDGEGVKRVASNLIRAVTEANIPHKKGVNGRVSISAGFACWDAVKVVEESLEALLEDADVNLFQAKEKGRNQAQGWI